MAVAQVVRCQNCGAESEWPDRFCATCGAGIARVEVGSPRLQSMIDKTASVTPQRQRLGGTEWRPKSAKRSTTQSTATAEEQKSSTRIRRKRKRRSWYRRKRMTFPMTIVLVFLCVIGAGFYRAESALSTVRGVSTPPSTITGDQFDENSSLTVDTAPAIDALEEADQSSDGGLLGGIKSAAKDGADLAKGAAAAAGIKKTSDDSLTVLIMGVDARPGTPIDVSVRSDVLIVAHINPTAGTCRLLAIPRDTRTNLPGYGLTKINHALLVGGIPYQEMVVEQTLGISVDAYALIDFTGFKDLVDSVGGVDLTVKEAFTYQNVSFTLGPRHLNGDEALLFARYRGGADGDIGRIRRQQQLIRALMTSSGARTFITDPTRLLSALEQHIRTDIGPNDASRSLANTTRRAVRLMSRWTFCKVSWSRHMISSSPTRF